MIRLRLLLVVMVAVSAGAMMLAACGGGGSKGDQGAAGVAVAEYFLQEKAGGLLPEGTNAVSRGGAPPIPLKAGSGESARYCIAFTYILGSPPFTSHTRIYTAALVKGAWVVTAVKPEGTCDGVS